MIENSKNLRIVSIMKLFDQTLKAMRALINFFLEKSTK